LNEKVWSLELVIDLVYRSSMCREFVLEQMHDRSERVEYGRMRSREAVGSGSWRRRRQNCD